MTDDSFGDEGSYVTGSGKNDVPPVRLEPGEIVPGTRYRIERWLGEGGVGVVYECRHVDIERRVALKVLKASVSPNTAKLFRDEAIAASKTSAPRRHGTDLQFGSPYVVEIFDFGEFPDGRLWFAMELLHGRSLSAHLKHEGKPIPMAPPRALGILRQLCKGLHTAHKAGFIHRDIKPANIMLTRRAGRDDFVKIVDFGVSAAATSEGNTGRSIMVGTPQYMAPEQTEGKPFDERLDVYAVGCVAYRMFTGRLPFVSPQLFRLMRMQREDPPLPPSEIEPDLPPAIERVILKCLEKVPENRYRDMADLEAALCEAQIEAKLVTPWDGLALPEVDPERRAKLLKGMPRRKDAGVAGARRWWPAVAALAIGAMTIGFTSFGREPPAATSSDAQVDELVGQARAAGSRAHWVYPAVDQPDGPTAYTKVLEIDELDSTEARVAAEELRQEFAEALSALGDRYWDREHGKAFAMDYYAQAQLFDPEVGRSKERAALTVGELALLRQQAASLSFDEAALRATEPLIALAEPDGETREEKLRQVIAEGTPRATSTEERLAGLLDAESATSPSKSAGRSRKSPSRESSSAPDEPVIEDDVEDEPAAPTTNKGSARSLAQQGVAALNKADRARAERLFNRALAEDSRNGTALFGMMRIQYDRGAYGKAAKYGRKAIAVSPNNASYRLKLGDAYYKNFQYDDARSQYKKAKSLGSKQAKDRLAKVDAKTRGG